jgi:CheY-like chemotaxis protein
MNLDDSRLEPVNILFIEDSPLDAEIVLRNFKRARFANSIAHVRDGSAALDYLFHRGQYQDEQRYPAPDLILLDLNLPRVSGWEILDAIRADEGLRTIPVVVMTSSEQDEDVVKSYQKGVNTYITKPVDFNKVAEVVQTLGHYWFVLSKLPRHKP